MNAEIMKDISAANEVFWANPMKNDAAIGNSGFSISDIDDAAERLKRFAPLIAHFFPETEQTGGIIESPLTEIENTRSAIERACGQAILGRLLLKRDSDLPISGSVKARGGIYEVLKHTEELALSAGLIDGTDDDIMKLATPEARAFFARHKVQVGSTGNLGLSIGIMSAALGYEAIVHMSADAKQWKKDLLRARGATVREYEGDYGAAVRSGRALSEADPDSYFVDDENSRALFCGYAVAGRRLAAQLAAMNIEIGPKQPLMVYIPCGVGGAPGGICLGLKQIFGKYVHVYFAEPTQAPCMLLGLATQKFGGISVQDAGLTGKTQADGLAVGRCSNMVAKEMLPLLSGEVTVNDDRLAEYQRQLWRNDRLFIEPSACAAFECVARSNEAIASEKISGTPVHIVWATGGSMVPTEVRKETIPEID